MTLSTLGGRFRALGRRKTMGPLSPSCRSVCSPRVKLTPAADRHQKRMSPRQAVLGGLPVQHRRTGAVLPGRAARQPCGPGEDRAWQCGAASQALKRRPLPQYVNAEPSDMALSDPETTDVTVDKAKSHVCSRTSSPCSSTGNWHKRLDSCACGFIPVATRLQAVSMRQSPVYDVVRRG